jgi:poly-gamma-glutamate capsule biosynthesis protein CapA/YwtB (metallophosphatase superfamily)
MNNNYIKYFKLAFLSFRKIEKLAHNKNFVIIFNELIDILKGNDLNIIDLEHSLTNSEILRQKICLHHMWHLDRIKILKYADINLAAKVQNHILNL